MRNFILYLLVVITNFTLTSQDDFRLERVRSIPNTTTINDILVQGNLIYVAASTGLYTIDADDLETRLLSDKSVDAVCHTVKGQIWASIEGRYIQNMATGETTLYNSPGIQIRDLEYSKGKIWIASNQGILTILTRSNELGRISYSKKSGLPSNNVAFVHIDKQKRTWIGTDKGIVLINEKEKWKTYEKRLKMEAMHYNHEGLWLVSDQEMWVIDPYNRWYPAAIDKGLRKGAIRDITADSTGRLYMASEVLVRYDPYEESIQSYENNTAIVSKVCTSVESDRDNRIWLGTKGGGLFLFGYADQARTVKDLVEVREQRLEKNTQNGLPEVEIALVESDIEEKLEAASSADALAFEKASENNFIANSEGLNKETGEVTSITSAEGRGSNASSAVVSDTRKKLAKEENIASTKLDLSSEIIRPINCPGELALVKIKIGGGSGEYEITWNDGPKDLLERELEAGTYRVSLRDSEGQTSSTNILIDGKKEFDLRAINKRSPTAEGRLDGNVKISISGGLAPYDIVWENGEKGDRARRLTGGKHRISVTDANGCKFTSSIDLKGARIMPDLQISRVTVGQKLEIKNIYFEADSTEITEESFEVLDEIYAFLKENTDVQIEIGGHTNSLPPDEYCDRVSTARAKSLADYLYEKGIAEDRLSYVGYGKRNPIASNETKEGRRRNQRVEVKIISLKK